MKQILIALLALGCSGYIVNAQTRVTASPAVAEEKSGSREQDGLRGPVRRVRVEVAHIVTKEGKPVESPRSLNAVSTNDATRRKIDSVANPLENARAPGKEQW